MPTRTSKIARLPKSIRHQLSLRIEDNQSGVEIAQWLNSLPDVQKITTEQFDGKPVSEQNISQWKSSGHLDWLRCEQARDAALHVLETSEDVDATAQNRSLGACLAAILTAEMGRLALVLLHKETDPETQWKMFCQINRELSRLRRDDDRAKRTAMEHHNPSHGSDRLPHEEPHPSKPEAGPNLVTMVLNSLDPDYDTRIRLPGSIIGPETAALLKRMKFSNHPASTSFLDKTPTNPQKSSLVKVAKA